MIESPGKILSDLIRNFGWSEFTVERTSDNRIPYGCHDLGNGNHVYGFISDILDGVYCIPGESPDMTACNFRDWTNLSSTYTGQYGGGWSMHDSEFVGGRMADDFARVPGEYALPYVTWYCDADCECGGDGVLPGGEYCELDIEGWLAMYRDIFNTEESF